MPFPFILNNREFRCPVAKDMQFFSTIFFLDNARTLFDDKNQVLVTGGE